MSGALLPATQSMIVVLGFYRDDTRASAARCDTAHTIILHLIRLHKSMSSIFSLRLVLMFVVYSG